jgi:hypothetical protein
MLMGRCFTLVVISAKSEQVLRVLFISGGTDVFKNNDRR